MSSPSPLPRALGPAGLRALAAGLLITIGMTGSALARPAPSTHFTFGWQIGDHAEVTATLQRPTAADLDPPVAATAHWTIDVVPRAEGLGIRVTPGEGAETFPPELSLGSLVVGRDGRVVTEEGTREARRLWGLFVERWIGTDWGVDEERKEAVTEAAPALGWRPVRTAVAAHFGREDRCGEKRRPVCGGLDIELIPEPSEVRASFASLHAQHPEAGGGEVEKALVDTLVYLVTEVDTLRVREASVSEAVSVDMVGGGGARSVTQAHYDFTWRAAP